jgi:hypothetical protein
MSMTATGRSDSVCVTSLPRVIIPGKSNTLSAKKQAFRDRTGTHILACHGLQEHKPLLSRIGEFVFKYPTIGESFVAAILTNRKRREM